MADGSALFISFSFALHKSALLKPPCLPGGELFSQRFEGYTLHVTALFEQVVVSWQRPSQPHREVGLAKETLDNHWHWVGLRYNSDPPSLLLEVDKDTQVIANLTVSLFFSLFAFSEPCAFLLKAHLCKLCI